MGKLFRIALTLSALTAFHLPALAREPVDLLLVLAADVSRSVEQPKFQLQREGYAAAISHPRVLKAITSGPHQRIALCFVEWSGAGAQKVVIDWTVVGDAEAAQRFGGQLTEAPRSFAERTSISAAIDFAVTLFDHAPYASVNGLVILTETPQPWSADHTNPEGGLENYYRDNVIGGPGAFVIVAENFNAFGQAIIRKMIAEVSETSDLFQVGMAY